MGGVPAPGGTPGGGVGSYPEGDGAPPRLPTPRRPGNAASSILRPGAVSMHTQTHVSAGGTLLGDGIVLGNG
jgi:hypothetical protein